MSTALPVARLQGGNSRALIAFGVVAAAFVAVAAAFFPLLTLGLTAGAVLVVVSVANLTYGVALFTLMTFFERLPGLEGFALSKPMGFVLVLSWLVALAAGIEDLPLLPRDRPILAYVLVLFVAWGAISALWATDAAVAVSSAVRLGLIVVLIFVVFTALRTGRDLAIVAWAYLSGAFLVSFVALATGANKAGRLALGELDPNTLAASLAAALALALFLVWGKPRYGSRLILLIFMCTYAVAIVSTESRGGLVALGVAAIASIALGGPFRSRLLAALLVVFALAVGYYAVVAPSEIRSRAASTVSSQREPRLDTWAIARAIAADHPIGGAGLGNFTVVESDYFTGQVNLFTARKLHNEPLVAHNTYLEILSELGIVGALLFASVVAMTLIPAISSLRALGERSAYAALTTRGLVVTLIVLLAAYFFVSGTYAKHLWLLFGVLAAVPNVVRSTTASADR